jgi:drug/metabolite transporter (DMT)-like permease
MAPTAVDGPVTGPATPGQVQWAQALLFIAPALWSVNYLAARWAPGVIAPHALALGRWALAATILGLIARNELWTKRALIRAELPRCIVLGALGMWVCGAFVYIGGRSTTAMNIGLLYAASPVMVVLASALWLREKISASLVLGVALALFGVTHIIVKGQWAALADFHFNPGDAWIAVCVLCWSLYSVLLRAWPTAFGAVARTTLIALGGVIVLIPFTILEAAFWIPTQFSWKAVGLVVATALMPGAGAYTAFVFMQRVLGAARVASLLLVAPLYSAAVAYLVLGEQIEWYHGVGALLILPGIWLTTRVKKT